MADKKISALTAATTPLAGTEVLPIVQSSATVKVSVANLTAGRAVSALSVTSTNDASINGLTVGKGNGGVIGNTAFGVSTLGSVSGFGNTALGYEALKSVTTGQQNVAVGIGAFATNDTGKQTVAVGQSALNVSKSSFETAIGAQAGVASTGGGVQFAAGYSALSGLTTGSAIGIGVNAGNNLTTGTNGIYIGTNAQPGAVNAANEIVIGTGTTGGGSNTTTLGTSSTTNTIIPAGNVTFSTAAKGVNFTANTPAAGMTSQLLNWYEEGTWTAVLRGATTAGTYEFVNNLCRYTRVGRLVTLHAFIRLAGSITGGGSGYAQITGLPFAKAANSTAQGMVSFTGVTFTGIPLVDFITSDATSTLYFPCNVSDGGTEIDISGFGTSDYIRFTITYLV